MIPAPPDAPVGLVLAGGRARRMGGGLKALVPFRGWPMLAHAIEALRPHCGRLLISANHPEPFAPFGLPVVPDAGLGRGPLAGIHAGLLAARGAPVLVLACDMPLVRAEDLAPLVEAGRRADVVIYGHERGLEPLVGWYGPGVLPALEELLAADVRRVSALFERVRTTVLPWGGPLAGFANANHPEDLARLEALETPSG
jgi:molybdopterin-guanine dinucleotide biosynthesis protein A